ncbi:B12-binding domain-containing radical SAM protein [Chloroflexota bacterium]
MSISKRGSASVHIGHTVSILKDECGVGDVDYIDYNESLFYLYSQIVSEVCSTKNVLPSFLLHQEELQLTDRLVFEEMLGLPRKDQTNQLFQVDGELIEKLVGIYTLAMESIVNDILASECDAIIMFVSPEISHALRLCSLLRKRDTETPIYIMDNYTFEPAALYFAAPLTGKDVQGENIEETLACDPLLPILKERMPEWVDWVIIGEGYDVIRTIFNSSERVYDIEGMTYGRDGSFQTRLADISSPIKRDDGVHIVESKPIELDSLPLPDFDGMERVFESADLELARGCSYSCVFCERTSLFGSTVRFHSIEYMERLVKHILEYDFSFLNIVDASFNINEDHAVEFLQMLKENGYHFSYSVNIRCRPPNNKLLRLLKETGCEVISMGIENADGSVLDSMNKEQDLPGLYEIVEGINEHDIAVMLFFIIGFPTETLQSVRNTIGFLQAIIEETRIGVVELELYYPGYIQKLGPRLFEQYGIEWTKPHNMKELETSSRLFLGTGLYGQVQFTRGMNRWEISEAIIEYQDFFSSHGIKYMMCKPIEAKTDSLQTSEHS